MTNTNQQGTLNHNSSAAMTLNSVRKQIVDCLIEDKALDILELDIRLSQGNIMDSSNPIFRDIASCFLAYTDKGASCIENPAFMDMKNMVDNLLKWDRI